MARLFRPHIPIAIRRQVITRQLSQMGFATDHLDPDSSDGKWLARALKALAGLIGCEVSELRLDHDPPIGAREKIGEGPETIYTPDANDPEHLYYRPHGAQFADSHDVKTRIRGAHGQFSDIALIKRARRRERSPKPKRGLKIKSRGFANPIIKPKWASSPFDRGKP